MPAKIKTTKQLESDVHCLLNSEGSWYLGDMDMGGTRDGEVEAFVVPSDDVPYE